MKYGMKKWKVCFWVALTAIFYLGVKSTPNVELFPEADKFYHWLAFSVLTFTTHRAFSRLPLPTLCAAVIAGSACIELLQMLSPDRTTSLADLTVNVVGVLTGLAAIQFIHAEESRVAARHGQHGRRRRRRRRSTESSQAPSSELHEEREGGDYVYDRGHH